MAPANLTSVCIYSAPKTFENFHARVMQRGEDLFALQLRDEECEEHYRDRLYLTLKEWEALKKQHGLGSKLFNGAAFFRTIRARKKRRKPSIA